MVSKAITLTVGGPRKIIEKDEAEQVKERFEKEMTATDEDDVVVVVEGVNVSCRQWTAEAIEVLRSLFEKVCPTLVVLDLSDTIAGLETSVGLNIMGLWTDVFVKSASAKLQKIYLSDNAMGPRALKCIEPLLGAPGLEVIHLNNCGLSLETIGQLDEALKVNGEGPGVARLTALALDKNMIGVGGAEAVSLILPSCQKLEYFSYCGCRPEHGGTKYITEGLQKMVDNYSGDGSHPFQNLRLWDSSVGSGEEEEDAIHALSKMLAKTSNLTHLNLQDCGEFGEGGTGMVVQACINSGCKLVDFNLGGNGLGPDGAEVVRELITAMASTLKVLNLETAELEDDGLCKIVSALSSVDNIVEELRLAENELEEVSLDVLIGATLPKLRLLSLKDNMELDDLDDKKAELRSKFPNAVVCIDDDDEEEPAVVVEVPDASVDALADQLAGMLA